MSADEGGVREKKGVPKVSLETSFGDDGNTQKWVTNIHFKEEGGREFGVIYFRTLDAAKEARLAPLGAAVLRTVFSKRYRLANPNNPLSKDRVFDFYFPRGEVPSTKMPYACVVYDEHWMIDQPGYEDSFRFRTQWMQLAVPPAPQKTESHRPLVAR